jgi:hypothetical protein
MLIKLRGILEFSPVDVTRKHKAQSSWKCVAIIKTDCDLDRYYAWFLTKRFNLELNPNLRKSHITFINDKMDKSIFQEGAKIFNGKEIDFYLELEPKSSVGHWWLRAFSPDARNIREALGLSRDPYYGLHLTLGNVKPTPVALAHSEYILEQCKRFELTSNEPRKPLDEYEIIDFTTK